MDLLSSHYCIPMKVFHSRKLFFRPPMLIRCNIDNILKLRGGTGLISCAALTAAGIIRGYCSERSINEFFADDRSATASDTHEKGGQYVQIYTATNLSAVHGARRKSDGY